MDVHLLTGAVPNRRTQKRSGVEPWLSPPKYAKPVYQTRGFTVYQFEQKMFDGRRVTYEAVWRPPTVNIIATVGNKVIVTRERQPGIAGGGWYQGMPGGPANEGETPLEGAKRELLEETGYTSKDWTLLSTDPAWSRQRWAVCWYLARHCKKTSEPSTGPNEVVEVHLVDLDEFLKQTVEWAGNLISDFAAMRYDAKKRRAFARRAFGPGALG